MFHPGKQTKKVTTIRLVPFHTLRITETPSNATDTLKSGAPSKSMLVLKVHGEKILFSRVPRIPGTNHWWKKKAKRCEPSRHVVHCIRYY